jgi:excisionase family DNA binding protein
MKDPSGHPFARHRTAGTALDSNQPIPHRLLHSPREVEILLGISHAQVYRLLDAGRLKKIKLGSRTGITRESIDALASGSA